MKTKFLFAFAGTLFAITLAAEAQATTGTTVIDPLNNTETSYYTAFPVLDNDDGGGSGVNFTESSGSLSAAFAGSVSDPEQALYLAPASDFSVDFAVGDTLLVSTVVPVTTTTEDIGLAISSGSATVATAGNSWNSRPLFDWASVSVRPSQSSVRGGDSINGTVTTSYNTSTAPTSVADLYITWVSSGVGGNDFALGYITTGNVVDQLYTADFSASSTIGQDIGFYGDVRTASTSLGTLSNLSVAYPIPEPSTWEAVALGAALVAALRRPGLFRKRS